MSRSTSSLMGALALVLALCAPVQAAIDVRINPTTGQVSLVSVGDTDFAGYELTGPTGTTWFDTTDFRWNSLADQSLDSMMELSSGSPNNALSEVSFSGLFVTDGSVLTLGFPYIGPGNPSVSDFVFSWGNTENALIPGQVALTPEPGTLWLLAVAAAASLAYAWRRRRV
jgi:hypothetical protein